MNIEDENPHPLDPSGPADDALRPTGASQVSGSPALDLAPSPVPGFSPPVRRPLPNDLRVPWDWVDLLLLLFISFCAVFCLSFLFATVMGVFGLKPAQMQKSIALRNIFGVIVQVGLDLFLLGYLAAQMRYRFRSPFWRTIGWRPLELDGPSQALIYGALVFAGIFLQALVTAASSAFVPKRHLPIQTVLEDRHASILFMLVAVLVAPLVEEIIFRGYIYPVVARTFGVASSILATGILFGLLHAPQLWGGWWQIALLILVGVIFTLVRAVSKTVITSYILHTSYNSVQVIAWLIGTYGLRHFPFGH
jgi:membrane protease YdiL (CAAX protease family)